MKLTDAQHPQACFHCGDTILGKTEFTATIQGEVHAMCCPGCQIVAESIAAGGLDNYYKFRSENALTATSIDSGYRDELKLYDNPEAQQGFVHHHDDDSLEASLLIEGINCAACTWLIDAQLKRLEGVYSSNVNLSNHQASVRWDPSKLKLSELLQQIARIGYRPHPFQPSQQEEVAQRENKLAIRRLGIAGIGMMQVMMYAVALYAGALQGMEEGTRDFLRWVSFLVATPVVYISARPFFAASIRDIKTRSLSMDVPVSIAIGGAYLASAWAMFHGTGEVYFDSVCMFTFLLLLGRYLEMRARHRSLRSGNALLNLLPSSCIRIDKQEREERITLSELKLGDVVKVVPGGHIPADGLITQGHSSVDESALTGEYMPLQRSVGASVMGGSTNVENSLWVQITHLGTDTRISGIVRLLERAQSEKPALAVIADRVARYFVAAVLIVAAGVFGYWSMHRPEDAFWITLAVLVVTCPCALSLATPTALTTATGTLQRLGLLITRGHVLEGCNKVSHVIFDKTGTLTQGKLVLEAIQPIAPCRLSSEELMQLACALEVDSEHPLAKPFKQATPFTASNLRHITGTGIEGDIAGQHYRLGKPSFVCEPHASPCLNAPTEQGQWLLLGDEEQALAWFKLNDQLRPEAASVIESLRMRGLQVELLSGDTAGVVKAMAERLGIAQHTAAASPDDKLAYIQALQNQGARILMVGDGINDVPVLAAADISMAMGSASDLAKTHADTVLLSANLEQIPQLFDSARRVRAIIRQNIAWALGYNLLALPLAAAGLLAPWMAAIGMASSSLIVVGNALRLSKLKAKRSMHDAKRPSNSASAS